MKNKELAIFQYVERYGIVDYKVEGNKIIYYQTHAVDCFGRVKKYKYVHNIRTGETEVKELYLRK